MEDTPGIDKYSVTVKTANGAKEASIKTSRCPVCGAALEIHGDVRKCPRHGTEPFER